MFWGVGCVDLVSERVYGYLDVEVVRGIILNFINFKGVASFRVWVL